MHCTGTQTIPSAAAPARSEGQNWCTAASLCVLLLLHIPSKLGLDCLLDPNPPTASLSGELLPLPSWTPQSYLKQDLSQSGIFIDLYFTCIK